MRIIFAITLFISILGCSPESTERDSSTTKGNPDTISQSPSISLVIDEAKISTDNRHLKGHINFEGFNGIQTDGRLQVAYYFYRNDIHERTDLKCPLKSELAHHLDRPHKFDYTFGNGFELDLDSYSSLLVIVTIKTTDQTPSIIQLCDITKIQWNPNQGMDPTR